MAIILFDMPKLQQLEGVAGLVDLLQREEKLSSALCAQKIH